MSTLDSWLRNVQASGAAERVGHADAREGAWLAYTRRVPAAGSTSSTAARSTSSSMPFSPMLLFEPTPTNRVAPAGLAMRRHRVS